jgi:hypothetical protein
MTIRTERMQTRASKGESYGLKVGFGLLVGAITLLGTLSTAHAKSILTAKPMTGDKQFPQAIQPLLAQRPSVFPEDGVYLYGQQPIPNQLATAYLVFEAQAGQVVGAFYMPHSSFDCVQGQIQENELALTITDSYSQEAYAYALDLSHNSTVASTENATELNIAGFFPLAAVSDNDQQILATCQAFYAGEI